jgi:hypothetical protein
MLQKFFHLGRTYFLICPEDVIISLQTNQQAIAGDTISGKHLP